MTPREYIETAMKLADAYCYEAEAVHARFLEAREKLETYLREHLDEIIEAAYDKGLEDRDEN